MDRAVKTSPRGEASRERTRPVVPRTRPGLVRGIAIGSVPLVNASCAAVFGAGPGPPVGPRRGREVWTHPLCMGPKFHFGEWIQFDGRLDSWAESCS
jgi:hypothetical protein